MFLFLRAYDALLSGFDITRQCIFCKKKAAEPLVKGPGGSRSCGRDRKDRIFLPRLFSGETLAETKSRLEDVQEKTILISAYESRIALGQAAEVIPLKPIFRPETDAIVVFRSSVSEDERHGNFFPPIKSAYIRDDMVLA